MPLNLWSVLAIVLRGASNTNGLSVYCYFLHLNNRTHPPSRHMQIPSLYHHTRLIGPGLNSPRLQPSGNRFAIPLFSTNRLSVANAFSLSPPCLVAVSRYFAIAFHRSPSRRSTVFSAGSSERIVSLVIHASRSSSLPDCYPRSPHD